MARVRPWLTIILVVVCVVLIARVGERHHWQVDLSAERVSSLSASAQRALEALPAQLSIEVYLPGISVQRAQVEQLLAPYVADSNAPRVTYIDPVADPERARAAGIRRHGEMHLRVGQRREIIRQPSAAALDAAINRLARRGERWIVALRGHGERALDDAPGGLQRFTEAAAVAGYRVVALDPRQLDDLPGNTAVVLVADPQRDYPTHVQTLLSRHLASGGALLWLADDPPSAAGLALSVSRLPGRIVDAAAARFDLASPAHAIVTGYPTIVDVGTDEASILRDAIAMGWRDTPDWQLVGRLQSGPNSWNETGAVRGAVSRDPTAGETAGPLDVMLVMQAVETASASPARVIVGGGAAWLGNDEIGRGANRRLAVALLNWLSGNEQLAPNRPAADLDIRWSPRLGAALAILLTLVLPATYIAAGLWLRSRHRRR
jgi:hypothetical protein